MSLIYIRFKYQQVSWNLVKITKLVLAPDLLQHTANTIREYLRTPFQKLLNVTVDLKL